MFLLTVLILSCKAERNISYLLILFQTVCRLQCLGSCCNIFHICLFEPASQCSSWPEKCEARSTAIEVSAAAARSLSLLSSFFCLSLNCASAVSAVVQVSEETDVWIWLWHLSLKIWKCTDLWSFPFAQVGSFHQSHTMKAFAGLTAGTSRAAEVSISSEGHFYSSSATKVLWHFIDFCAGSSFCTNSLLGRWGLGQM